ncbi:MAG: hypothetical protein MK135_13550, partial [Polyangiaceae bacterium]|nr:hypothetical protein [Polyangiaceae bacterium]
MAYPSQIRRIFSAFVVLLVHLCSAHIARAAATPDCSFAMNQSQTLLGQTVSATALISNSGSDIGYGPAFNIFTPTGLDLNGAQAYGNAVTVVHVADAAGPQVAVHPLSGEPTVVPAGYAFDVVRVPLSAFAPGQPETELTINYTVSSSASLFVPLLPQASCGFFYGEDPQNNPSVDPPIEGGLISSSVTPTVVTFALSGGGDVCSGPGSPITFQLEIDASDGVELRGGELTGIIDSNLQVTGSQVLNGPATIVEVGDSIPGGDLEVTLGDVTGAPGVDVLVEFTAFFPEFARDGVTPVIDPTTGQPVTISQSALYSGASYLDTDGITLVPIPDETALQTATARGIQLRQSLSNRRRIPGQSVDVQIDLCTSEFLGFDQAPLVTTLPDGLDYFSGPPDATVDPLDPRIINIDRAPLTVGATETIVYTVDVNESYDSGDLLLGGDLLPIRTDLSATPAGTAQLVTDSVENSVEVRGVSFQKTLEAINGGPVGSGTVRPGDVLTFRLEAVIESGDINGVTMTDYLPAPFLVAEEHGLNPGLGPEIRAVAGPDPDTISVSPSTASNTIAFTYAAVDTSPSAAVTLAIEIDYTVADAPVEDGVQFVNLLSGSFDGSSTTFNDVTVEPITVSSPKLNLTTSVLSTTNPNSTLTPALPASCNSSIIATTPYDADLSDADAEDTIRVGAVVENLGEGQAIGLRLSGNVPAEFGVPTNIEIQDCAGNNLNFNNSSSGQTVSVTLTDNLEAYDLNSGDNILILSWEVTLPTAVTALTEYESDFQIDFYTGRGGSTSNYVGFYANVQEFNEASVTIADFAVDTSMTSPSSPAKGTIQDVADYLVEIEVPEGTHDSVSLTYTFPSELALQTVPVVQPDAGVTTSTELLNVVNNGREFSIDLGTVT